MRVPTSLLAAGVASATFTATASAASAVSPDDGSLLDLAKPVLDAIMHGQWAFAAALALILAVTLTKRYLGDKIPWLHSDAGGAVLALLGAFGGALATSLAAGAAPTWIMAWMAVKVAVGAAGAYSMIRKLLVPWIAKLRDKLPGALRPVLDLVLWVFDKQDPIARAERAGDAAVKAKPASGAAGVTGKPDELE